MFKSFDNYIKLDIIKVMNTELLNLNMTFPTPTPR